MNKFKDVWPDCPFCGAKGLTSEYDSYGTNIYCEEGCHGHFNFPAFQNEVKQMWKEHKNRRKKNKRGKNDLIYIHH
jgi:hypothetical protein